MRYIVLVFIILFSTGFGQLFVEVPLAMQGEVAMLLKCPETRSLLDAIESEGHVKLLWMPFEKNFHACWSPKRRFVALNSSKGWREGEKLYSILFELHNASTTAQLVYLDQLAALGQMEKQQYIEAVERIEYRNALNTNALVEKGVRAGYFPREMEIPVYPNFQEHFAQQMHCGHAGCIGQKYEDLST